MKKILLLIFISLSLTFVNAQNQVNVKKATVTDWIIYKGDTLSVVSVNEDTIFVVRGNTKDTLLIGGFWSVIGDSIYNNNGGDLSITGLYLPDLDEASKTGKVLHINQYDKVEWMSLSGLGDDIDSARAAAPTAYTTWVRDSVNGVLSPATATDLVEAHNFKTDTSNGSISVGIYNGDVALIGNTFIGVTAGYGMTNGSGNTFIGSSAGGVVNSIDNNTFIGYVSGSESDGDANTYTGYISGYQAIGTNNVAYGLRAGQELNGDKNTFFGTSSGYLTNGDINIGIGMSAAETCIGDSNIFIGINSGYDSETSRSIGIGNETLTSSTGNNIIAIGNQAGKSLSTNNVFVVKQANLNTTPLIEGDLLTNDINFRKVTVDTLLTVSDSLNVQGEAEFDATINADENINIAATTSTVGQFLHNKTRFLHTYTDNAAQPNIFIGENSGNFTTTGNYNYAYGNNTLQNNTTGLQNFAAGAAAMNANTEGGYNMAIGGNALYNNKTGSNNVAIGYGAQYGVSLDNVSNSVSIGTEAGLNNMGDGNISIGTNAMSGGGSSTGADNVCIGALVMYPKTTGSRNVGIGKESLRQVTGGSYNTAIGFQAGYSLTTGEYNVMIGYNAGYNETGSNKLYIDNSNTTTPLIGGDFSANTLTINGAEVNPKGTLANNDVSPSVAGGNVWQYNGTANSVTLDALDDHVVGAFYTIIGNSDTYTITVIDGTPAGGDSFNLAGGNWVGGSQDVLMLYCIAADAFVEVSRSDN